MAGTTLLTESIFCQQMRRKACFGSDMRQRSCIDAECQIAREHDSNELHERQADSERPLPACLPKRM